MKEYINDTVDILDHGYIKLLDYLGDDQYLADTARVSTQSKGKSLNLVNRLVADRHSSPLEFGIAQFEIKAPLFVFREWHRHRTQSYSEMSARFGELPMDFYLPSIERMNPQHETNKQMSDETKQIHEPIKTQEDWSYNQNEIVGFVQRFRELRPLARELSQRLYPQTRYTICRASGNLWNWIHFLDLRTRPDAQYEIRQYANEIEKFLDKLFPVAMDAYREHIRYAVTLSRSQVKLLNAVIREGIHKPREMEMNETWDHDKWLSIIDKLGVNVA